MGPINPNNQYKLTIEDKEAAECALITAIETLSESIKDKAGLLPIQKYTALSGIQRANNAIDILASLLVELRITKSQGEKEKAEEEK